MPSDTLNEIEDEARRAKWTDWKRALRLRLELDELLDQFSDKPARQANNLNQLAWLAAHCDDSDLAVWAAEKCVAIYSQIPDRSNSALATYLMMLASMLAEADRFEEAIPCAQSATALHADLLGETNDFVVACRQRIEDMRNQVVRHYIDRMTSEQRARTASICGSNSDNRSADESV